MLLIIHGWWGLSNRNIMDGGLDCLISVGWFCGNICMAVGWCQEIEHCGYFL